MNIFILLKHYLTKWHIFYFKLFKINLYELEEDGRMNENKLLATGFYKANKYLLENSLVDIEVSMMSANQIAGTLKSKLELIIIKYYILNIKKFFIHFFNSRSSAYRGT